MSKLQVANIAFEAAATTRIDADSPAGNVRITAAGANVYYVNPTRTVIPTGTLNVDNELTVSGRSRLAAANLTGDVAVTGNIYSSVVDGQSVSMGYIPWSYVTGNTTLTWTGLTPAKKIKLKFAGVSPGATSILRLFLSSDGGTNYGPAIQLGMASPQGNNIPHDIIISNTAISGANKIIIASGAPGLTANSGYAQINTESTITGVINAVKCNSTGVITFTSGGGGVGGVIIYGEV